MPLGAQKVQWAIEKAMIKTRISFYHFPTKSSRWWAFKQMREAHQYLAKTEGLRFYKLLGTGAGDGFSIKPDWAVYAFLQVWESTEDQERFFDSSWVNLLEKHRDGEWHFDLSPYHSKGTWHGQKVFGQGDKKDTNLMAVITRARIKWTHLLPFWLSVPTVSRVIKNQKSLLFQKGIGEWPLIEQATFSLWDREKAMREFAYQQEAHRKVVQKTRRLNWYKEEQFTRFAVLKSHGFWPDSKFDKLQE